jgi:hypothetical protein
LYVKDKKFDIIKKNNYYYSPEYDMKLIYDTFEMIIPPANEESAIFRAHILHQELENFYRIE